MIGFEARGDKGNAVVETLAEGRRSIATRNSAKKKAAPVGAA
jgi:hypothetical protein